jgi:hypothetical protein
MGKIELLTEEMFMEGGFSLEEPRVLSYRDRNYFDSYASHLTKSDVEYLCEILQHPPEEIFTKKNKEEIVRYGSLQLGGKEYPVGSCRIKDILLLISDNKLKKNDVLHDTSKLLTKHDPEELSLKVRAYNYLIKQGYVSLKIE